MWPALFLSRWGRKSWLVWSRFWFGQKDLRPLHLARIVVALCIFVHYLFLLPWVGELFGPLGWIPRNVAGEWSGAAGQNAMLNLFGTETATYILYGILLLSAAAIVLNRAVFIAKWLLFLSHLVLLHCNPVIQYGADRLAANLLVLLALAPANLNAAPRSRASARWGSACLRLVQILLCVMYFVTGLHKIHGDPWWEGNALWIALTNHEFNRFPLHFLAANYWLANLLTFTMPLVEIAYPFLMANRRTRFGTLIAISALHLGICISMGMIYFSFISIAANLVWLDRFPKKRYLPGTIS